MSKEEAWHRRHAVQIAAQLPDKTEDALAVLRAAIQIVTDFLAEPEPEEKPKFAVVPIRGSDCA